MGANIVTSTFSHEHLLLNRDLWLSEMCLDSCSAFMAVDTPVMLMRRLGIGRLNDLPKASNSVTS